MSSDDIRDLFYLGFYGRVIDAGCALSGDPEVEALVLLSRLHLRQIDFVLGRSDASPPSLGARLLAQCLSGRRSDAAALIARTADAALIARAPSYALFVACAHLFAGAPADALRALHPFSDALTAPVRVHALLRLHRIDLAAAELSGIANAAAAAVARAHVALMQGADETRSALFALLDLLDRYPDSPALLSLVAASHFALGEWESGRSALAALRARSGSDLSADVNYAAALARTSELAQLRAQVALVRESDSAYAAELAEALSDFDATAARIAAQ